MKTHQILISIIDNIKIEEFQAAQDDCTYLPDHKESKSLYVTIGAIDSQPTEQAFERTKSAAIAIADRLIGRI